MEQVQHTNRPGGTYFFTVRTAGRGGDLLVREVALLRRVTRQTQVRFPFQIDEAVILGDVLHMIWTLPEGDTAYAPRWRMIKSLFSRALPRQADRPETQPRQVGKGVWQRRWWEYMIRDDDDFAAHRHMIYTAPVQAGLVTRPEDWPLSSIHRALRNSSDPLRMAHRPGHAADPKTSVRACHQIRTGTAA